MAGFCKCVFECYNLVARVYLELFGIGSAEHYGTMLGDPSCLSNYPFRVTHVLQDITALGKPEGLIGEFEVLGIHLNNTIPALNVYAGILP